MNFLQRIGLIPKDEEIKEDKSVLKEQEKLRVRLKTLQVEVDVITRNLETRRKN